MLLPSFRMFRPNWEDLLAPVPFEGGPRFGWGLNRTHCLACQHAVRRQRLSKVQHSFGTNCVYQRVADRPGIRASAGHLTTLGTVWRRLLERDGVGSPRHCFVCAHQFEGGRIPDPRLDEERYCTYEANCRVKRRRVGPSGHPIFLESSATRTEEPWNAGDMEHPNALISGEEANRRMRLTSVGVAHPDHEGWGIGLPGQPLPEGVWAMAESPAAFSGSGSALGAP